jgi:hypothetical protein
MAMDFGVMINGVGRIGRAALIAAFRHAGFDPVVSEKIASFMYRQETGKQWPPADDRDRVLWRARAGSALQGVSEYLRTV